MPPRGKGERGNKGKRGVFLPSLPLSPYRGRGGEGERKGARRIIFIES